MTNIQHFNSANGATIFRLPLEVFSGYIAYSHLVKHDDKWTLIDVGSGFVNSHDDLVRGIAAVGDIIDEKLTLVDVNRIIVTHGHIDHFGGLRKVKDSAPNAEVAIHALAKRVLINYDERVWVTSRRMGDFLRRAGVPEELHHQLMQMYLIGKQNFEPVPVDDTLLHGDVLDDVFEIIHVPGHSSGLIMVRIGDILITSDHILPQTSVALSPESIMPSTGVGHYLESLHHASQVEGITLALGGHEEPMKDYYVVAERTRQQAVEKIDRILSLCDLPRTIYELAELTYPELNGYAALLKINQVGARIEYLHQRGLVVIDNLDELEHVENGPWRYIATN